MAEVAATGLCRRDPRAAELQACPRPGGRGVECYANNTLLPASRLEERLPKKGLAGTSVVLPLETQSGLTSRKMVSVGTCKVGRQAELLGAAGLGQCPAAELASIPDMWPAARLGQELGSLLVLNEASPWEGPEGSLMSPG